MTKLVISEIFFAPQGEGVWSGTASYFLRTAGCSVKCAFCDTRYSWAKDREPGLAAGMYQEIDIDDIVIQIVESNLKYVVVTGGEPAEQARELEELVKNPNLAGRLFTIETSGNIPFDTKPYHLLSCSPKMNGMMGRKVTSERYAHLGKMIDDHIGSGRPCQLKFVVKDVNDYNQAKELVSEVVSEKVRSKIHILFQPNNQPFSDGTNRMQEIASYASNFAMMSKMFVDDVKKGGIWSNIPHVRMTVQQHWIGFGRLAGT